MGYNSSSLLQIRIPWICMIQSLPSEDDPTINFITRKAWDLPKQAQTPVEVYKNRREFLKLLGVGTFGAGLTNSLVGCSQPTDAEIEAAGAVDPLPAAAASDYPAQQNPEFEYGRPETLKRHAAEFTNFFEFSEGKENYRYVGKFQPAPWTVEVDGLCSKPRTFDLDDVHQQFQLEERMYRFRCVERWAMCVPWTGFLLRDLLKVVEPQPTAKFVVFETFNRPDAAPGMKNQRLPWPYTEGLRMDEATNELTFLATGIYGEPLPKQHGAPIRLVVPWKYGFKSAKSIVKITLTDKQPATFWNTLAPHEYKFEANVDPEVPHPRWSQNREWMLPDTTNQYETVIYNGYGEYVGGLYS